MPEWVEFQTKPTIALEQVKAVLTAGIARGVVLADASYGNDTGFRDGLTERALALGLSASAYRTVTWRQGSNTALSGRFAAVRVRAAHRDHRRTAVRDEEWFLIEWPEGQQKPEKYVLSTLPVDMSFERLVAMTKMRWRIEHDYQELKQEFGLAHYEGRGWRGFHHHASLCIAAYGFLVAERLRHPATQKNATLRPQSGVELVHHHDADNAEGKEQAVVLGRDVVVGDIGHRRAGHVGEHAAVKTSTDPGIGQQSGLAQQLCIAQKGRHDGLGVAPLRRQGFRENGQRPEGEQAHAYQQPEDGVPGGHMMEYQPAQTGPIKGAMAVTVISTDNIRAA